MNSVEVNNKFFRINKNTLFLFMVYFFLINLIFYSFFLQDIKCIIFSTAVIFIFSIFNFIFSKALSAKELYFLLLVIILLFPGLLKIDYDLSAYFYFCLEISVILFVFSLSKIGSVYVKVLEFSFYIFVVYVFWGAWTYREYAEPLSHFIPGSSQNGIPSYLIVLLLAYLAATLTYYDKLPVFPAILTFLVAFIGDGRGSIVISAAIVFICAFYILSVKSEFLGKILIVFGFLVFLLFSNELLTYLITKSKLSVGLYDSHRANILYDYISSLNWYEVIIGGDFKNTIIEKVYNNNPHISYVRLHSLFGIFSVALVFFSPFIVFLKGVSLKGIYMFLLLYVVLARAATEPIMFPTLLDFFYIASIYVFINFSDFNYKADYKCQAKI